MTAFEPRPGKPWRQVAWKRVGRGEKAELEARALAVEMERQEAEHGERVLSWHVAGERLPLDRTVRDYVYHHSKAIGGSTARRYAQFGERLIARVGRLDLRDLREEDIAAFVTAEFQDGRAKAPTINACVLLRSVMRAAGCRIGEALAMRWSAVDLEAWCLFRAGPSASLGRHSLTQGA